MNQPALPYAGTSGWSGSDTSRERAERSDSDGTTAGVQGAVLSILARQGTRGATWHEIADELGVHHGTASGALSVLHKVGSVSRLRLRRSRSAIYVLPEFVMGRATAERKRRLCDECGGPVDA
jgi:hypothetical protein